MDMIKKFGLLLISIKCFKNKLSRRFQFVDIFLALFSRYLSFKTRKLKLICYCQLFMRFTKREKSLKKSAKYIQLLHGQAPMTLRSLDNFLFHCLFLHIFICFIEAKAIQNFGFCCCHLLHRHLFHQKQHHFSEVSSFWQISKYRYNNFSRAVGHLWAKINKIAG